MKTREQEIIEFINKNKKLIKETKSIYQLIIKNGLILTLDYLSKKGHNHREIKEIRDTILSWLKIKGIEIYNNNNNLSDGLTYSKLRKATLECLYLISWARRLSEND
ncbi:MAG: type III-B CRISPR module-associated protein Cmr5 [Candidatus Calescibacterium sp.]|nr:hypothetical protein [Candidatus Calescibacterium sp.]MDW8133292.1 type III-B CRISPR module-associated protein Cmr5 [Candidatus Calescibacterium sp.]